MLANILRSLTDDNSDSGGIAQLVVTALGSGGQHYICWKTHSGEYRQQSNGLPKALQDWLFPADGSTRDFETLQVILSSEDSFFASDRNGEVRSEPSSTQQRLRRALTFSGENSPPTTKRWTSRAREHSVGESERPRSNTLPSASPTTVDHLPAPHLKPPTSHGRSSSADKLRRISLVSMAFNQQRRSWATRPRSVVSGAEDLGVLKEQPSPRRAERPRTPAKSPTPPPPTTATEDRCTCGHHDNNYDNTRAPTPRLNINIKPRTGYADASIQTDPTPSPDLMDGFHHRRNTRHSRRESSVSTASTFESSYRSNNSSKRSSFETTTTRPDSQCFSDSGWEKQWQPPLVANPIIMGRMQDYFRSSNYTLGAALQPQGFV
ncbi:hypothetical protein F4821DRAFT_18454 [Hypoxylon rubiginosum]|uniref:Uncharacterized protein n=1 Tax=Hypoxylon rubiginosum TaxID=110542 RepID=A0ACC0CN83_9PEZI|nr:hypothetical protein F4821DRAFT_18454 [Hypoxylon rubiginosum]